MQIHGLSMALSLNGPVSLWRLSSPLDNPLFWGRTQHRAAPPVAPPPELLIQESSAALLHGSSVPDHLIRSITHTRTDYISVTQKLFQMNFLFFHQTIFYAILFKITHLFKAMLHYCHIWIKLIVNSRLCHSFFEVVVKEQGIQNHLCK